MGWRYIIKHQMLLQSWNEPKNKFRGWVHCPSPMSCWAEVQLSIIFWGGEGVHCPMSGSTSSTFTFTLPNQVHFSSLVIMWPVSATSWYFARQTLSTVRIQPDPVGRGSGYIALLHLGTSNLCIMWLPRTDCISTARQLGYFQNPYCSLLYVYSPMLLIVECLKWGMHVRHEKPMC